MRHEWQPSAGIEVLRARAELLAEVRAFFADLRFMEVETPVLAGAGVTDPHLENLTSRCLLPGDETPRTLYLQTSPEYAMKRLLAAGSGPIYQICKVFRNGEAGRLHNPEFTMLEWYAPGLDYRGIMDQTERLLRLTLGVEGCERITYAEAFRIHVDVDALQSSAAELQERVAAAGIALERPQALARDDWLDLLLSQVVGPRLGLERPAFLTEFPASQAALARIADHDPSVSERFEVFVGGMEIANGFHELCNAEEQRRRFEQDNARRITLGLKPMEIDERLLAALAAGMPDCSGVALGLDRLLLVKLGRSSLADVMAFTTGRA